MAAKTPEPSRACDICGLDGLNERTLRIHVLSRHLEGMTSCPFCDFVQNSPEELAKHANSHHPDHLIKDNEILNFIDDDDDEEYYEDNGGGGGGGRGGGRRVDDVESDCLKKLKFEDQTVRNVNLNSNNVNNNNNLCNNNNNNNGGNTNSKVLENPSAGAEGSPLRMQLNLNFKKETAKPSPIKVQLQEQCMLCGFFVDSPTELEEHINREHFDLTSPSTMRSNPGSPEELSCPLCIWSFQTGRDLELHVNMKHGDILSPGKASTPGSLDNWGERCPVCYRSNFDSNQEMIVHIDDHFNFASTPDLASDRMLAKEIEKREMECMKEREKKEFEQLQAQYGMDNQGNFKEQSLTNMQKAVYAGEMSVSDFYERQIGLRVAENSGVDDGSSRTKDLIPKVRAISHTSTNVIKTLTSTVVDHYASTYGDEGWGCGYRNLQMLISSLLYHTGYNEHLFKHDHFGGSLFDDSKGISRSAVPSISKLQQLIESAWRQGFDAQGCDQLGGTLHNTRKWIGATEVVTALSYLRIRCQLIDFDTPTGPEGSHPALFNWVLDYFQKSNDFKPPLYLQHLGHSRTIVGIEEYKDGHLTLLVFDPSHSREQMSQLKNLGGQAGMKLIRRTLSGMKARQYQLVAVRGIIESESEYQQSKLLRSSRIQ